MKAIIPTAGVGKRLQPFTHALPKVLLQVADKPILGHIIDKLVDEGIHDVTFIVGYRGSMIEDYVAANYPDLRAVFVEQSEPRGLGHAIYLASPHHNDGGEPVLIILGDTIIDADLGRLRDADCDLIGVREVEDPRRFGVVELDGDRITAMVEKPEHPKTNLAIVGVYYLRNPAALFQSLQENIEQGVLTKGEIQLTDALQKMLDQGAVMKTLKVDGWHDCGKPETLLATNRTLLEKRFQNEGAALEARFPTAKIKPPVCVGEGAEVSDSILGPHVSVGRGARVKNLIARNTIINDGAQVRNACLADSIIGNEAVVADRALRLYVGDKSEVVME